MTLTKIAATSEKQITVTTIAECGGYREGIILEQPELHFGDILRCDRQIPALKTSAGEAVPATGADLKETVDHGFGECRSLRQHEGKEADEHDPPDELGEPAVERCGLQCQPHRGNPDFDSGENPEQRFRCVHDGGFPPFGRTCNLVLKRS
jgi:hypothetical protein